MNQRNSRRIGIKDIASKAGVSIGTVDRVLHNRGEVKEETRDKINQIIEELGYTPNLFAQSLASKRNYRIALIVPDTSDNNPYWNKPAQGIQKAINDLVNYNVEIIQEHFNGTDEQSFADALNRVSNAIVDAVVMTPVFRELAIDFASKLDIVKIPFLFFDVDVEGLNNLSYFGQDARQSGFVAAKLMDLSLPFEANILVVKQTNHKIFSRHIESRVEGLLDYFAQIPDRHRIHPKIVEIDLLDPAEPEKSFLAACKTVSKVDGIFIPNSRTFRLADSLNNIDLSNAIIIGYDLLDQNIELLKQGKISCLINQKPEEQSYRSIVAMFHFLASGKKMDKTNHSPIDIIVKENVDYYI